MSTRTTLLIAGSSAWALAAILAAARGPVWGTVGVAVLAAITMLGALAAPGANGEENHR